MKQYCGADGNFFVFNRHCNQMLPALIQPFFPLSSFLYPNIYKHDQTEWVLKYICKLLGKKSQDPSVNHLIVTLVSSIKIVRI